VTNHDVNMYEKIQSIFKYRDLYINIFVFEFLYFCTIHYCTIVNLVKPTMWSCSIEFIQNLLCNFWTYLQVSTNFGHLNYFSLFN
jgi:hypothetical protein